MTLGLWTVPIRGVWHLVALQSVQRLRRRPLRRVPTVCAPTQCRSRSGPSSARSPRAAEFPVRIARTPGDCHGLHWVGRTVEHSAWAVVIETRRQAAGNGIVRAWRCMAILPARSLAGSARPSRRPTPAMGVDVRIAISGALRAPSAAWRLLPKTGELHEVLSADRAHRQH